MNTGRKIITVIVVLVLLTACCLMLLFTGVVATVWEFLGDQGIDLGNLPNFENLEDYADNYNDNSNDNENRNDSGGSGGSDDSFDDSGFQPDLGLGSLPDISELPVYRTADCPFPGGDSEPRFSCGYLYVAEDHGNPNSSVIVLAVAVLRSSTGSSADTPLVYLEGGPGGSALDAAYELWIGSSLGAGRDIILIDQRGTGYSHPSLNCIELDDEAYYDYAEYEVYELCADRLWDEGIDLTQYNSVDNAADINDLRIAMGYDQIDLFGISYGTRLALNVMRYHPEALRAVIIDSVYPPQVDPISGEAIQTMQALEVLFDGCLADPICDNAFPELEAVFYETYVYLNEEPLEVEYEDGSAEDFSGDSMVGTLIQSLYDAKTIPYLPAFIYALYDGDVYYAYDILDAPYLNETYVEGPEYPEDAIDVSDSEGMYTTVTCNEEVTFADYDDAESSMTGYPDGITQSLLDSVYYYIEDCAYWEAGEADPVENTPVESDIPTLILNGEYDPVTPPEWAYAAADYLSNSQIFIFPGYGHAVVDAGPCPGQLIEAFLDDPYATLDSSCVATVGAPSFETNP